MIFPIAIWPDPVLMTPAETVTRFDQDLRDFAASMLATMYDAVGRGLAAPQVSRSLRLFVMDTTWKEAAGTPQVFVNPVILESGSETVSNLEGCLSIPDLRLPVERPSEILARWQDQDGHVHEAHLSGIEAICFQHEYDHLDGILTLDRTSETVRAEALLALTSPLTPATT